MGRNYVTEISLADFLKLDLKGYEHDRNATGDDTHRFIWKPVSINDIVQDVIRVYAEEADESLRDIAVALHVMPEGDFDGDDLARYAYLDRYMNAFTGMRTYQVGCNTGHIYSTRDWWEARTDYWRVLKSETEAVYLIRMDDGGEV